MNNELLIINYLGFSGILYALGGTGNWPLASKLWRRLGNPVVTLTYLLLTHHNIYLSLVTCGLLFGALTLPYGDSVDWKDRFLVAIAYTVPSWLLGFTLWQIVLPVAFLGLFWASRQQVTAKYFQWKVCEFIFGILIATTFIR